jgi:cation diffusion facilitator CzcD-associated flavoprotein CzcO
LHRCACDVAAHNYTYSFEPKPDWSAVYAGSGEILKYFNDFTDKYDLRRYIRVQCYVVAAEWNEASGEWVVSVKDAATGATFQDNCDILINAAGILNAWKWPDIPGLSSFKGPKLHSANWDDSISLEGKSIALIGNG